MNYRKILDYFLDDRKENHRNKNTTRIGVKNDKRSMKRRWKNHLNKILKATEE